MSDPVLDWLDNEAASLGDGADGETAALAATMLRSSRRERVELKRIIKELETGAAEQQESFALRYAADMRGIKMWQEAHPGKELTWPDHADLVVHLMERIKEAERDELKGEQLPFNFPVTLIGSYMMPEDRRNTVENQKQLLEVLDKLLQLSPNSEVTIRAANYVIPPLEEQQNKHHT